MNTPKNLIIFLFGFLALALLFWTGSNDETQAAIPGTDEIQGPFVGEPVQPGLSPAVRALPASLNEPTLNKEINPRHNPLLFDPDQGKRGTWDRVNVPLDPLIQPGDASTGRTPGLDFSFEGTGNPTGCGGCSPPDTVGDVGPNHYIQMVNSTKVAIFDKSGTPVSAPFNLGTLWLSGFCTADDGDPIVLYDSLADRWLLSQFASPSHMCVAISQTADPTGSFYTYTFDVGSFPDYFKFGVWPDAYYMSANEDNPNKYTAYAFDRVKMLTGQSATFQKFTGGTNLYLPGDLDGATPPPAGAPNYFYTFKDNSFHGGADRLEIREFDVDWVTPANSTFTLVSSLNVTPFTYTVCGFFQLSCIRQAGTTQRIDSVSEWPMFRFPYRNFGTHQSLVGTFTVGGGLGNVGAAIRWFELRNTGGGWTLFQEGTLDPGDGHDRFMASIAMDGEGNIALGYSVSSNTMNPAIRYATRLAGDPLGTMQAEAVLINGAGSQTTSNRWGDYSAMAVDPADDCTFWYTNEYYPVSSGSTWKTRVGVFQMPECGITPPSIITAGTFDVVTGPDSVVNQTLTIGNTGDGDLDWSIDEKGNVIVGLQPVQPVSTPPSGSNGSRGGTSSASQPPLFYKSPADFSEDFADITNLPGWFMQNNSNPLGSTNWFQGDNVIFSAQAGASTAYVAANFNNAARVGTISNWLLTPELSLSNGDTLSFWTRAAGSIWPDRLQVRVSTSGASTDVGTGAEDLGDFTTLLLDINPTLTEGGYPELWTQFTVTLSGIPNGSTGRFAFRYYVTNAGPAGTNANYIGIDSVEYLGVCTPMDIPWLSASPASGTTPGGGSSDVAVVFDSTGLGAGVYTGTLCINSNDPVTPLVIIPLTLTVDDKADLSLTKTAPSNVTVSDTFAYTLEVANAGLGPAFNTTLTDTLPSGVSFVGATAGCLEAGGVVTCDLGDLGSGATATVEIVVRADAVGALINTAEVSSASPDPMTSNNSDSASTDVAPVKIYLPTIGN